MRDAATVTDVCAPRALQLSHCPGHSDLRRDASTHALDLGSRRADVPRVDDHPIVRAVGLENGFVERPSNDDVAHDLCRETHAFDDEMCQPTDLVTVTGEQAGHAWPLG